MKRCERCGLSKPKSAFYQREDRIGQSEYAWCISCCKQEGRVTKTKYNKLHYDKGYLH